MALRFLTARDLYDGFATAADDLGVEATDEPSLDFARRLVAEGERRAALGFCAYLLPKREAVWWAIGCLRELPERGAGEEASLAAGEAWVREPEEARRLRALDVGMQASSKVAGSWVALAAGWSGGNLSPAEGMRVPVPPQLTAQGVRVALLLGAARLAEEEAGVRGWIEAGIARAARASG